MRALLTSRASSLRPLVVQGQRVLDMHQPLSRLLAARTGDPDLGLLLASPRVLSRRDEIVWDTPAQGEVVRLSQASGELRAQGEARFEQAFASVREIIDALRSTGDDGRGRDAAALEAALTHAGEDDFFLVGGKPVLANWGCTAAGSGKASAPPARTPRKPVETVALGGTGERPVHRVTRAIAEPETAPSEARPRRRFEPWLAAWGVVAVLLIAEPFAVRAALTSPAAQLERERRTLETSIARLREASSQVTAARRNCPPGDWTPAVFASRLEAAKARTAPLVALAWNGAERLELGLALPSGQTVHPDQAGNGVTGGESLPQRVAWLRPEALGKGHYGFSVRLPAGDPPPEQPASWAMQIHFPGQPPVLRTGFIRAADAGIAQPVFDFDGAGP